VPREHIEEVKEMATTVTDIVEHLPPELPPEVKLILAMAKE
jgi:hypothetical protein